MLNVVFFCYQGWKNERVVQNLLDARIILVRPTDSKVWWKKIKDLSEIINRDLGYYDMELNTENLHVSVYFFEYVCRVCLETIQP